MSLNLPRSPLVPLGPPRSPSVPSVPLGLPRSPSVSLGPPRSPSVPLGLPWSPQSPSVPLGLPRSLLMSLAVRIETRWGFSGVAPSSCCRSVWQGVSTDSLKFHLGSQRPVRRLYALWEGHPRSGFKAVSVAVSPSGRVACGRLVPLWIPHAW
jgi:hypothetical protein